MNSRLLVLTKSSPLAKLNKRFLLNSTTILFNELKRTIKTGGGPKKGGGEHGDTLPTDPTFGGDSNIFVGKGLQKRPPGPKTVEEFADVSTQKNWISYGFDPTDMKSDRLFTHVTAFGYITLLVVLGAYIVFHYPDLSMYSWAQREAFIELHRREKLGLPLVDKNYANPDDIILPEENQIEGFEVYL